MSDVVMSVARDEAVFWDIKPCSLVENWPRNMAAKKLGDGTKTAPSCSAH